MREHAYELHGDGPADLARLADAASSGEVIYLTRDGKRIAADAMERAEDAWLAKLAAEALAEEGESVPLEQVKAELGL